MSAASPKKVRSDRWAKFEIWFAGIGGLLLCVLALVFYYHSIYRNSDISLVIGATLGTFSVLSILTAARLDKEYQDAHPSTESDTTDDSSNP